MVVVALLLPSSHTKGTAFARDRNIYILLLNSFVPVFMAIILIEFKSCMKRTESLLSMGLLTELLSSLLSGVVGEN
jgi:hypothetical protein